MGILFFSFFLSFFWPLREAFAINNWGITSDPLQRNKYGIKATKKQNQEQMRKQNNEGNEQSLQSEST